ncbi:unnamed protein product [Zymoseptoria tritici ST99CH_1A5]|uniref:Replication termination factor 2 n=4 Tax=Zymoseptoria tritici TaxID=1047171 RepID=F9X6L9_ZYMTI|nr:uncharacterized protein MYCGRDRAFT_38223 [Zymoseptoria tritici IPO323]SMQ48449.1 unnamed protein product [Zymoseptoria tritici ST99CH_3D7]SMR48310.1 unnamed protein product [Zymoseptoria tritici ST99CH_1E4]SMR49448.1 unnamed protein product [Zymoseptoria tritici ST99CH_3D1]SMY22145.1 unnamed protein product [Zymoseptoria tritici ST99CH_1A5]EGP88645.1 hypothetical protein MYCGRDRAFT_38223 [Zymoseptoria tritici IPO323]
MGNDGGSIPTRRELVKESAKNPTTAQLKETLAERQTYLWTTDPISREPLKSPVVSDSAGKLYNKATILEFLVEGKRAEDAERELGGRVAGPKDLVEVKFTADGDDDGKAMWKCPVTGDKLGPGSKAVYIVPCGHAFSGTAIKEVAVASAEGEVGKKKCLTCDGEYAENDVVPIVPVTEVEVARLVLRVKTLKEKGLAHSLKKLGKEGKKRKKGAVEETGAKDGEKTASNGINNASTASLTAKVMQEQEKSKKRKMENENVRSLFSSRDQSQPIGKSADFMTRGYSLPSKAK